MALSNDLISQFVKATNDNTKIKAEKTIYGTTVEKDGHTYVRLDGSDQLTPITTTADTKPGERVMVVIKNHSATIIGNISSPAARVDDIKDYSDAVAKINEFEIAIGDKVSTKDFDAEKARIDSLQSDNVLIKQSLTAAEANVTDLTTKTADITEKLTANTAEIASLKTVSLTTEAADAKYATISNLDATNATVHNLESTFGDFKVLTTNNFSAVNASIESLKAGKLSASDIEGKYANIDFSNIGQAAMEYLYSQSGLIRNVEIGEATITGQLAGVTISGDLIEANTVKAEKLIIKGSDGLYYKLNTDGVTVESEQTNQNSLNGSIILAKSVTASKVNVDDLVAFDATIGGFKITESSIYSGVKTAATNTTRGVYLDNDGQASFGDATNYLKYYKTSNGTYKLDISASSILLSTSNKNVETVLNENSAAISTAQSTADTANSTANANKTNLANHYYTKTQTDAKIKVESDKITSAVSRISANETAISTLEQTADGLEVRLDTTDSNVATAQSTANTANTTANSVKTDLANNYTKKTLPDTRNDNQAPSWYFENYPKQIITEFKYCSKIGLSGVGTYCTLQTIVPWNDSSGGYPKQTAKVETTGKEFWRVGTSATTWSNWIDAYGLASTANSTANTANTNAANAAKTATNFLSYDSTNGLLIGNKSSGSWSGTRAQITSSTFNVLDQNGVTLASYGSTTTIGKTSGNNVYIDSDSIDIRKNGKVLATFDQYGLKIANTNDSSGSLGSGTTKPALVIGTATGYHIEMDNNEIMAKSDATSSSHLFLNMEGGNVSFNNNANRAMMFQEGALFAKNASFNNGNYLGVLDALNDAGNTALGYGGYTNKIGGTNIYGNSISLYSNSNIDVEASWINCRSIAPNEHATYALGIYGEKGWSNIYLGKGDGKTNALHIINGSSTYLLCGVNSSGQYVFGNNAAIMYYQVKNVWTDNTGNAFKFTSGNNAAANNTTSVWLFGAADETSRYIGSYLAYDRTYSSAANMVVTANGVFGRSTSSSERYKNSIVEADISELSGLYNMPVKKFKYNSDYIAADDELYDKYLYGFLVEDLEAVLPCAVEHITDEYGNVLPEMWNSNIIVPSLLKLIQDLNNRVTALEGKE